jgi:drug/metabolite transporter (DMT)-like permease
MNLRGGYMGEISEKTSRGHSVILLIITAIMWSTGGVLIKLIKWHPIAIAGARSAIAAIVMVVHTKKPKFTWSLAQILGAIAYALTVIFLVSATKLTTSANAIMLQYTAPIYVAIFGSWFLDEKTKWYDWITIILVIGGMVLFFIDEITPGGLLGNILGVLSGITFGLLTVFMRKQKDGSPVETALLGNILTAIIGLPFIIINPLPDSGSWGILLILGIFQIGIPYILYSHAIKHVTALEGILIPIIEPILNPIWVFLFNGEKPGTFALIGSIIVIFAVTGWCILQDHTLKREQQS